MNPNLAKIDRTNEHYTFDLAQSVKRTTVTFRNHFGIELAGDLYTPEMQHPQEIRPLQFLDLLEQ